MYPLRRVSAVLPRQGDGDTPGMLDEPCHFLGGALARGDDEVAFVLAGFVVHDDDELAAREGFEGVLDGVELEGHGGRYGGEGSCYGRTEAEATTI